MLMIHSIIPYAYVSIDEVRKIANLGDRYFMIDDYGWWQIEKETYDYLEKRGIPEYARIEQNTQR